MILRVAQYGEDVLRIKGEKIQKFDDRLEKFSRCMWETMEAYEGIGLVRTLDAARGIIECWVMPDGIEVFETILRSFRRTAEIQPMDRDFD